MKNKTIAITSALLIGGLLTLNNSVFADVANATTSASIQQKPFHASKMIPGKRGDLEQKQFGGMQRQGWDIQLDALVKSGTITQAKADSIQAYLSEQKAAMKADMEKIKAMTEAERKAYFERNKPKAPERFDILSTLVEKGIITQTEADAIKAAEQAKHEEQRAAEQAKQQEYMTTALNKLVDSKVITAGQVTKITEYMAKEQSAREVEMQKVKAMTKEQRDTYFKSNAENKGNMLAPLVTDKILTQAQADAVVNVLHPRGFSKGFGKGADKK